MKAVLKRGFTACVFLADSKNLEKVLSSREVPVSCDWRAHGEVMEIWSLMGRNEGFKLRYLLREDTGIAHNLANLGRIGKLDYTGFSFPLFLNC